MNSQVPPRAVQLSSLSEDLEALGLLPSINEADKATDDGMDDEDEMSYDDTHPDAEAEESFDEDPDLAEMKGKKGKKKDKDDEGYDYDDEYEEDIDAGLDIDEQTFFKALAAVEEYEELTCEEIDGLSDEAIDAISYAQNVVEAVRKRMPAKQYRAMLRSRKRLDPEEKKRSRKRKIKRKRNKSKEKRRQRRERMKTGGRTESRFDAILDRLAEITDVDSDEDGIKEKVVEGLKTAYRTADTLATNMARKVQEEVSESEDGQVDDKSEAWQFGEFFHSIAEDSFKVLSMLENGDLDLETSVKNLQSLGTDLRRGLERLSR